MKEFKLANQANLCGTSLQGYFGTSYAKLEKRFGEPNTKGDEFKVSTEWAFQDSEGNAYLIYEYKMTNVYDSSYMTVEEFKSMKIYQWHIGCKKSSNSMDFINWLEKEIA